MPDLTVGGAGLRGQAGARLGVVAVPDLLVIDEPDLMLIAPVTSIVRLPLTLSV